MRSVELERWVAEHELSVTVVWHLLVDGDDVDVLQPDVQSRPGLAVPEEVGHLLRVGDVVGGRERAVGGQVVDEHVLRRRLNSCS